MLRTIGCIERTLVATRPDVHIEVGQSLTLHEDHVAMLDELHPGHFIDLTPRALFAEYGLEIPHRHALFFTAPCSACPPPGGPPRVTTCRECGNTHRTVFL